MTIIKGTWAYVAVGGVTLKCLRALRNSFFVTRMWRALFTWEEWKSIKPFNLIVNKIYPHNYRNVSASLFSYWENKIKATWSWFEFLKRETSKTPFSKWDILDYWTGVLFSVHYFLNRDDDFDFIVLSLFPCLCMLSWIVLVYTQVIYRVCVILAWFRS